MKCPLYLINNLVSNEYRGKRIKQGLFANQGIFYSPKTEETFDNSLLGHLS